MASLNFDENTTMSKEEEEQLQERLKAASKNTQIFQNKVRDLNDSVNAVMKRKKDAQEALVRRKNEMKELEEKLAGIHTRYQNTSDRLALNRKKAESLRKLIKSSEGEFSSMIRRTKSLNALSLYKGKETETNLVAGDLAAERGYTCKSGSTFGHIASISAKSFF